MGRSLGKARATSLCDPQGKRNTIASSNLERERERKALHLMRERVCVLLANGLGKDGEAPSSMEQGVVKLACQDMALCVSRVKREEPKLSMKA